MAEKNTHSILETIKKKLNKFDSKTAKTSKISDAASEFEYITPPTKPEVASGAMEEFLNEKPVDEKNVLKAGDELNLDDFNEKLPEIKKEESLPIEQPSSLDLDSEIPSMQNEEPAAVEEKITPVENIEAEAEMNEDDVEDYEDEVDFSEEDEEVETDEEEAEEAEEEIEETEEESEKDELSFEDDNDSNEELKLEDEASHDLDHEEVSDPLKLDEESEPEIAADPLNLEEEPEITEETADPLHLEEESEINSDPLNLEEDHDRIPEAPKAVEPLEIEEEKEVVAPPIPPVPPINPPAAKNDELDFSDMLDLEEDLPEEKSSPLEVENKAAAVAKEAVKEQDPFEMELEALDKELAKKTGVNQPEEPKEIQQSKPPIEAAKHDEIDLEFEQEMMGSPERSQERRPEGSDQKISAESEIKKPLDDMKVVQKSVVTPMPPKENFDDEFTFEKEPKLPTNFAENSREFMPEQNQQNQIFPLAMDKNNKAESRILNDTTIMQTSESIRKLVDAKNVVAGISNFSQSPALAELATQLMEPKLEKWLNENLGSLVEKIVREEIKKIIPKE